MGKFWVFLSSFFLVFTFSIPSWALWADFTATVMPHPKKKAVRDVPGMMTVVGNSEINATITVPDTLNQALGNYLEQVQNNEVEWWKEWREVDWELEPTQGLPTGSKTFSLWNRMGEERIDLKNYYFTGDLQNAQQPSGTIQDLPVAQSPQVLAIEKKTGDLFKELPRDSSLNLNAPLAPHLNKAAQILNAKVLTHIAPYGVYPAGFDMNDLIIQKDMRGQFYFPIVSFVQTLGEGDNRGAIEALTDFASQVTQMSCKDLGKALVAFDQGIYDIVFQAKGEEKIVIASQLYNLVLPLYIVMADAGISCGIRPPIKFLKMSLEEEGGEEVPAQTLLDLLGEQPNFSLKQMFWVMDIRTLRLARLELQDPLAFLNKALFEERLDQGICTFQEMSFGGAPNFPCPQGGQCSSGQGSAVGGVGSGMPDFNLSGANLKSAPQLSGNLIQSAGSDQGNTTAWGQSCSGEEGGGGGGAIGSQAQCLSQVLGSHSIMPMESREANLNLQCILQAVGGGGGMQVPLSLPGGIMGSSSCQLNLAGKGDAPVPDKDAEGSYRSEDEERQQEVEQTVQGRTLERNRGRMIRQVQRAYRRTTGQSLPRAHARAAVDTAIRQARDGDVQIVARRGSAPGDDPNINIQPYGGKPVISVFDQAGRSTARETVDAVSEWALGLTPSPGSLDSDLPIFPRTQYEALSGRSSTSSGSRRIPDWSETCDPSTGASCGSFACGSVPLVMKRFVSCREQPSAEGIRPDPCEYGMCPDAGSKSDAFFTACVPTFKIAGTACTMVTCPAGNEGEMTFLGMTSANYSNLNQCRCGASGPATASPGSFQQGSGSLMSQFCAANPDRCLDGRGGDTPGAPGGSQPPIDIGPGSSGPIDGQ